MILGCGDIGLHIAQLPAISEWRILGVRRTPPAKPSTLLTTLNNFEYCAADSTQSESLAAILPEHLDYLIVTMTPSDRSEAGYQKAYVDSAHNIFTALNNRQIKPKRIFFISSTSVYGQTNGEPVDESSLTEPAGFSGRKLLEAEAVYQQNKLPSTIIRFSGIYGPGRFRLIQQALNETDSRSDDEPVFSNRLHIEDCTGILGHLLIQAEQGVTIERLYIGTDSEPSDIADVKQWMRDTTQQQLGSLPVIEPTTPSARKKTKGYARSSKRLSNQRLINSGYEFIYPTYREGYRVVLNKYLQQLNVER
jgi:nucleoside-diphosphate-sugar epimerase